VYAHLSFYLSIYLSIYLYVYIYIYIYIHIYIYEPGPRTPTPRWYGPPHPQTSHLHRLPAVRYLQHLEAASRCAAFESHNLVTGPVWGLATTTAKFGEVPDGKATMDAMTFIDGNAELIADMHLRHLIVHTRPLCEKSMQSSARISSHVVSIYVYFISKQFLLTGQGLSKIGANGTTAGKKPQFSP